jgi:hypothetical protein
MDTKSNTLPIKIIIFLLTFDKDFEKLPPRQWPSSKFFRKEGGERLRALTHKAKALLMVSEAYLPKLKNALLFLNR